MSSILMIWTVVAGNGLSSGFMDWRPIGEFVSAARCEEAAKQLSLGQRYRCVQK